MQFLDHTLPTAEENLALDEALLIERESGESEQEVLRLWDAHQPLIVLGRSSKIDVEVHRSEAMESNIRILRRSSGGASVLAASGCLFYSVLVSLKQRPQLRMLDEAHRFVMARMVDAIRPMQPEVTKEGTCDIVLHGKKVSGNSLRVQRNWMLYHGTLLLEMDVQLLARFLQHPPREPSYRAGRSHQDFVGNLHVERAALGQSVRKAWNASVDYGPLSQASLQRVASLVEEKYSQPSWNYQR